MSQGDTIVAPATPPGRSAVAMVRLSGPRARDVLQRLFHPRRKTGPARPWALRGGAIADPQTGAEIDQAMAVWMPAPRTYTGEDVVEITVHGAPPIVEALVRLCIRQGARLADPGEFTRRAFLNGRIDLAEAEAVCDLIASETEASIRTAQRQLAGELSQRVSRIREALLNLSAEIEARIDFPEEEIPPADAQRLAAVLQDCLSDLDDLLEQGRRGRRLREGARVAIVGRANVGKSSVFNALVGMERAISTPHPGTTRDTIEARVDLQGLAVDLVDTAGIRHPENEIEGLGIERSKREIERADAVIWVIDRGENLLPEDRQAFDLVRGKSFIPALNKADLPPKAPADPVRHCLSQTQPPERMADSAPNSPVLTCALTRQGIPDLESRLRTLLLGEAPSPAGEGALVSNVRHVEALAEARGALRDALDLFQRRESPEFVMVDVRTALDRIGAILGLDVGDEVLDRIFQKFCLGK